MRFQVRYLGGVSDPESLTCVDLDEAVGTVRSRLARWGLQGAVLMSNGFVVRTIDLATGGDTAGLDDEAFANAGIYRLDRLGRTGDADIGPVPPSDPQGPGHAT